MKTSEMARGLMGGPVRKAVRRLNAPKESLFWCIAALGALTLALETTFCGPVPRAQGMATVRRAASNGFMFFSMGGSEKEKFVVGKIFPLVKKMKGDFSALEWQPIDARGTRYLNAMKPNCADYYAAAKVGSWQSNIADQWKSRGGRNSSCNLSKLVWGRRP